MRFILYSFILAGTLILQGCTQPFDVYFRNFTDQQAVIDVHFSDLTVFDVLPNRVHVANRVSQFKSGYRKWVYEHEYVKWEDAGHLTFVVKPKTTVYVNEVVGKFTNGSPHMKGTIVVLLNNKVDTLLDETGGFRHNRFAFKYKFPLINILHYDIR